MKIGEQRISHFHKNTSFFIFTYKMQDAVVKMNFGAIIEPTQECQSYTCTDTNQGISFVVNLGTSFLADEFDFVIGSIT